MQSLNVKSGEPVTREQDYVEQQGVHMNLAIVTVMFTSG